MGDVIDLEEKRKSRKSLPPPSPQAQAIIAIARHVQRLIERVDKIERELAEMHNAARR